MLDHFIAKNATARKVNVYHTLAISYCTFCVGKHTILGPVMGHCHPFVKVHQNTFMITCLLLSVTAKCQFTVYLRTTNNPA